MERYIGLDAHASSCTLAVVGPSGKRLGCMSEPELACSGAEEIGDPVPATGRLDDGLVRALEGGKVAKHVGTTCWELSTLDELTGGIECDDHETVLLKVDSVRQHEASRVGRTELPLPLTVRWPGLFPNLHRGPTCAMKRGTRGQRLRPPGRRLATSCVAYPAVHNVCSRLVSRLISQE